jgi:hypothetical protein
MQNGVSIDASPAHTGTVSMARAPGLYRSLLRTEGSVTSGIGSTQNKPTWETASLTTYNTWIRNGRTGAKPLNLPLITVGGTNPDLVRPVVARTQKWSSYGERLGKASLKSCSPTPPTSPTCRARRRRAVALDGNWRTARRTTDGLRRSMRRIRPWRGRLVSRPFRPVRRAARTGR